MDGVVGAGLILVDVRLMVNSLAEAQAVIAELSHVHGDAITLRPPRPGRSRGTYLIYGTLALGWPKPGRDGAAANPYNEHDQKPR